MSARSGATPTPRAAGMSTGRSQADEFAGVREKVTNEFGVTTSKWSVTLLGHYEQSAAERVERQAEQTRVHERDFKSSIAINKQVHPVKRELHMQKFYPGTVNRLQQGDITRKKTPEPLKNAPYPLVRQQQALVPPPAAGAPVTKQAADVIRNEFEWNQRFCQKNKTGGRIAVVKDIITGDLPLPKHCPLFPVKGSHQSLLGIDNKLVGANPMLAAPMPDPSRRWLGDHVGWEGNRGLPTPDIGAHGRDGHLAPWPSHQYGHLVPKTQGR